MTPISNGRGLSSSRVLFLYDIIVHVQSRCLRIDSPTPPRLRSLLRAAPRKAAGDNVPPTSHLAAASWEVCDNLSLPRVVGAPPISPIAPRSHRNRIASSLLFRPNRSCYKPAIDRSEKLFRKRSSIAHPNRFATTPRSPRRRSASTPQS